MRRPEFFVLLTRRAWPLLNNELVGIAGTLTLQSSQYSARDAAGDTLRVATRHAVPQVDATVVIRDPTIAKRAVYRCSTIPKWRHFPVWTERGQCDRNPMETDARFHSLLQRELGRYSEATGAREEYLAVALPEYSKMVRIAVTNVAAIGTRLGA